jgi:hypothetical protein
MFIVVLLKELAIFHLDAFDDLADAGDELQALRMMRVPFRADEQEWLMHMRHGGRAATQLPNL